MQKKYAKYASKMQVFMILLNIACNMQNMQNNVHDMQNMQTSFPICRICTAHFAADSDVPAEPVTTFLRGFVQLP